MTGHYSKELIQTAHAWRELLDSSRATSKDLAAFEAWMKANPEHEAAYIEAQELWDVMGGFDKSELTPIYFQKSLPEKIFDARQSITGFFRRQRVGIGLVGSALAATAAVFFFFPNQTTPPPISAPKIASLPDPIRFYTANGEVRSETLPDGSVITLGAVSAAEIIMTEEQRSVTLRSGEAFFDVTRDETRPFVVTANEAEVRVLGTSFEVKRRPTAVEVGVAEGQVEVSVLLQLDAFREQGGRPSLRQTRTLSAGQRIATSQEIGLGTIAIIQPDDVGAWRQGSLNYKQARLADILADTNRYSDTKVTIGDPDISDLHVTATIDTKKIASAFDLLSVALPIEFNRLSDTEMVVRKRNMEKN